MWTCPLSSSPRASPQGAAKATCQQASHFGEISKGTPGVDHTSYPLDASLERPCTSPGRGWLAGSHPRWFHPDAMGVTQVRGISTTRGLGAPAASPAHHRVGRLQTSCHGVSHGIRADLDAIALHLGCHRLDRRRRGVTRLPRISSRTSVRVDGVVAASPRLSRGGRHHRHPFSTLEQGV